MESHDAEQPHAVHYQALLRSLAGWLMIGLLVCSALVALGGSGDALFRSVSNALTGRAEPSSTMVDQAVQKFFPPVQRTLQERVSDQVSGRNLGPPYRIEHVSHENRAGQRIVIYELSVPGLERKHPRLTFRREGIRWYCTNPDDFLGDTICWYDLE